MTVMLHEFVKWILHKFTNGKVFRICQKKTLSAKALLATVFLGITNGLVGLGKWLGVDNGLVGSLTTILLKVAKISQLLMVLLGVGISLIGLLLEVDNGLVGSGNGLVGNWQWSCWELAIVLPKVATGLVRGFYRSGFRLSWLTNSALVYEPKCGGRGSCGVSANEYSCTHGAQISFWDPTPYLTYGTSFVRCWKWSCWEELAGLLEVSNGLFGSWQWFSWQLALVAIGSWQHSCRELAIVLLGVGIGRWELEKNEHFLITLMNKLTFKGLTKPHKYFTTTVPFHRVH